MAEPLPAAGADYSKLIREQTRQVDLDSFRERGVTKVNVINAKKINELIEQAVTSTIARLEHANIQNLKDEKSQVILDSMNEFRRLLKQQQAEAQAAPDPNAAKDASGEAVRELKAWMVSNQAKQAQEHFAAQQAAEAERRAAAATIAELRKALDVQGEALRKALSDQTQAVREAITSVGGALAAAVKDGNAANRDAVTALTTQSAQAAAASTASKAEILKAVNDSAAASAKSAAASTASKAEILKAITDSAAASTQAAQASSTTKAQILQAITAQGTAASAAATASAAAKQQIQASLNQLLAAIAELRASVAEAAMRPASADPEQMKALMAGMQRDLMAGLEKAGVVRTAAGSVSADEAVAGAVLRSAFREMGDTEANLGGTTKQQTAVGGDKAAAALERLKQMRQGN